MPPDDLDREKLYSSDPVDDDGDLELEPVDPELIAAEQRRAAAAIGAHRTAIDVNEVYRDFDASRDSEIMKQLAGQLRGFRFQFQIKHLLVATAVVAVLLTLHRLGVGLFTVFALLVMGGVAGLTIYLKFEENKRQEEADRRRQKMYAARRAEQARLSGQPADEDDEPEPPTTSVAPPTPPSKPIEFRFSLQQLLLAVTAAAVLLGLITLVGGPAKAASLCGLVALAGLVLLALGIRLPEIVLFGWWVMLALYVVRSLAAAFWSGR